MRLSNWVFGVIALCISFSILITVVDSRIFNRKTSGSGNGPSATAPPIAVDPLSEANTLLRDASVHIDQAAANCDTWSREIEPLLQGPAGETVAADADLVDRIAYLKRSDRLSTKEIETTRQQIGELQETLDQSTAGSAAGTISPNQIEEIRGLAAKARIADEQWAAAVSGARAIVGIAKAKASTESTPDLNSQIEQANHEATLKALDAERIRKEEEAAQERERLARLEEEKREQKQQEQETVERALSPQVVSVLAPFLEARDVQPKLSGSSVRFSKTLDKRPMSLSALQGIGAMADSIDGLKRLASVGGHRELTEPRWSVNSQPGNWTDDDKEMLQQAQDYLRDYGPILVKTGKMAP